MDYSVDVMLKESCSGTAHDTLAALQPCMSSSVFMLVQQFLEGSCTADSLVAVMTHHVRHFGKCSILFYTTACDSGVVSCHDMRYTVRVC